MASLLETSSRRTGSVASPAVWAVLDRLGSVVAQIGETDSSAAVRPAGVDRSARFSQVAQYGDYGTQRFGSSGWTGAAGFTGQPGSPAGVNLFFARGYEPATGSWLSADPYRPGVADPASLNRYAYVSGNPATLVDLLGFRPVDPFDGYGTNTPSLQRSMGAATARLLGQARAWQAAGSPAIHTPAAASKPTQRHEYWWDNWSADMWQNIGAAVAGVATAVVVTAAVAGLVACTAATFGGCGVAAAIIGGAVAGAAGGAAGAAVTYGLSTGKKRVQGLSEAVGHGLITGAVGGALFGGVGSAVSSAGPTGSILAESAPRLSTPGSPSIGGKAADLVTGRRGSNSGPIGIPGPTSGNQVRAVLNELRPGRNDNVFTVDNSGELRNVFARLIQGAEELSSGTYPGKLFALRDRTIVGWRSESASGGPTIDINFVGSDDRYKIHVRFPE